MRIHDTESQIEAHELAYRLSIMETIWDGKDDPPENFKQAVKQIIKEPY